MYVHSFEDLAILLKYLIISPLSSLEIKHKQKKVIGFLVKRIIIWKPL